MKLQIFCVLAIFSPVLFADSITVNVGCTNGASVANLSIHSVMDHHFQPVTGLTPSDGAKTDGGGNFIIENSELFTPPFFFFFNSTNGSTCGGYLISIDPRSPFQGQIQLPYYPTNVPCSCANLGN